MVSRSLMFEALVHKVDLQKGMLVGTSCLPTFSVVYLNFLNKENDLKTAHDHLTRRPYF